MAISGISSGMAGMVGMHGSHHGQQAQTAANKTAAQKSPEADLTKTSDPHKGHAEPHKGHTVDLSV